MRIRIDFRTDTYLRYVDSMNAALVAGLVDAGLSTGDLVGRHSLPWTFGMAARARPGGERRVFSVTVSSPSERFCDALYRLNPEAVRTESDNGDRINLSGAKIRRLRDLPEGGVAALMIGFASPFLIPVKKQGREKTRFHDDLTGVDLNAALTTSLSRRAGRPLDLTISVDRLSFLTDLKKHLVHVRLLPGGKPLIHPAFSVPMSLKGNPQDVRFAFLAGIGAKTHAGFGCPILMN